LERGAWNLKNVNTVRRAMSTVVMDATRILGGEQSLRFKRKRHMEYHRNSSATLKNVKRRRRTLGWQKLHSKIKMSKIVFHDK
jgi:ABC-type siderophore export system fused ATPase/permease subunit